jgi:hypothetical protein
MKGAAGVAPTSMEMGTLFILTMALPLIIPDVVDFPMIATIPMSS